MGKSWVVDFFANNHIGSSAHMRSGPPRITAMEREREFAELSYKAAFDPKRSVHGVKA